MKLLALLVATAVASQAADIISGGRVIYTLALGYRPEEYDNAVHVLMCARDHDPTDRSVHEALGERHYLHAVAMRQQNDKVQALAATNLALANAPKHPGANRLLQELTEEAQAEKNITKEGGKTDATR